MLIKKSMYTVERGHRGRDRMVVKDLQLPMQ